MKNYNLCFQIEGAFVQGLGFFMLEEYETSSDGFVLADGTWNYKIPTIDTLPKQFNVEILNSGHHKERILSSKGMMHTFLKFCHNIVSQSRNVFYAPLWPYLS